MSASPQHKAAADDMLALDSQFCFALYSASHAMTRSYKPMLEQLGLTYPQYLAMLVLWEQDGVLVKDIGARLFLDSGMLTPLLKRLEANALLTRTRDAHDERQVRIHLTEAGRGLREPAARISEQLLAVGRQQADTLLRLRSELSAVRDDLFDACAGER